MRIRLRALSLLLLLPAAAGLTEEPPLPQQRFNQSAAEPPSQPPIGAYPIAFRPVGVVSGLGAVPAIQLPYQCGGEGTIFINVLTPTDPEPVLYGIRGTKATKFPLPSLPDYTEVGSVDYFPTRDGVAFLLFAADRKGALPARNGSSVSERGPRKPLIVEVDTEGNLKRTVPLPETLVPSRIAVLGSNEFLIAGFDRVLNQQTLKLFSSDGSLEKSIDQPMSVQDRHSTLAVSNPTMFVAYGQHVLAWRAEANQPVLDVGERGIVREVAISLPRGYSLYDLVSSDSKWIVHSEASHEPSKNNSDLIYMEVSPYDGSVLRTLLLPQAQVTMIACHFNNEFISFGVEQGRLLKYIAR